VRILLVGHSLLSPWTDYTHRALERLGHSVERFYCTSLLVDRLTLFGDKNPAAKNPGSGKSLRGLRDRWHRWRDRRLIRAARACRPDLLLVLWGNTLSPELLCSLKKETGARLATWWLDDPFRHKAGKLIPLYDFFFIFDRSYLEPLKNAGAQNARFLPCACDESVYFPRRLTPRERTRYASDVAWVAWYYPDRGRIVQALEGVDLKIWGRHWPGNMAEGDRFVKDTVAAKIYSATKIGLNSHSDQSREGGLNTRSFELLAAGAFELTDAVEGMEELLEPGRELAVYRSPKEAEELVRHYLKHPEERTKMARAGRERVLAQHTYLHRMKTLLGEIER